ncbi:hypothetical protein IC229_27480 [Spirosoma sp. BT702]|uniref:Uncharacterized protein n=1 Tax=Spirosoma profusum TaxID=2771354 RepID=A0A927ASU2_9BACT|nr:hypothetical protein [Spirosoma profusum]MBD2704413.1 hypothetical protein [Spirosoma profusum]
MEDGLYLYGQWVSEVSVALTKQSNDLTSPNTLQVTYANLFTLSDTTAVRTLLQNAEQLDAAGKNPYRLIPAQLISDGEVIFTGNASLLSFMGGWKVSLSGARKGLFDQLADIKLKDLDLNRYNHPWTIEVIDSYAESTEGICYPAIDYGSIDNGAFAQDTLTPAVFNKTLIRAMLQRVGYTPKGDWLTDPLLNRVVLPFVEEEPKAYEQEWVDARMARVTVATSQPIPSFSGMNILLPLTVDNNPLAGWRDGRQDNYKAETYRYVPDTAMRLRVQAFQTFQIKVDQGAVEAMLIVEKNGQNVYQEYQSYGGPYNLLMSGYEQLKLNVLIECRALDQIQVRFIIRKRTTLAQFLIIGFVREEDTFASFEPDASIVSGDNWQTAINLPDMNCADLLKSTALMCSATWESDDVARTLELKTLNGILDNEVNATDLSHCVDESDEPENNPVLAPYGQKNLLKWKPLEDKTLAGYGDGVIGVDAQNIPLETPLFELPFSAVIDSKKVIGGYGSPPFIETRTITGTGANVQVQRKSTSPRLLLVEPTKPVTVTVNVVTPDLTISPTPVRLMASWWYTRPEGAVTTANSFSLAFDRPPGTFTREQTLIQRYFGGLKRVLRRPRQLTLSAYMRPSELATLDLYSPVRIQKVRAGSLDINDNYFYINQIKNYQSASGRCSLVLIPY